jgi:hypothetical protein
MPDQKARIGFPGSAFKATAKAVSAIGNSSLENLSIYAPAWDNSFTLLLCSIIMLSIIVLSDAVWLLSHAAHKSGLRAD